MAGLSPRHAAPDTDDGLALACKRCGHLWPQDVTMGVVGAHMETEHGAGPDDQIELELVVLCPRGGDVMTFVRQETGKNGAVKSWWDCPKCHRTRVVRQDAKGDGR